MEALLQEVWQDLPGNHNSLHHCNTGPGLQVESFVLEWVVPTERMEQVCTEFPDFLDHRRL